MCSKESGFTLVEILVASTIGVFIALVAVGTLRAVSVGAEMVGSNIDTAAEVRFAAERSAADLTNIYRDRDSKNTRLVGMRQRSEQGDISILTLYTIGRVKARSSQPEGDVYEVEYYLSKKEDKSALMRRLWPNPDEDAQPGGILTKIAEDIDIFEVRYFDGQEWLLEWSEQIKFLPQLAEVTIAAGRASQTDMVMESFIVNFGRSVGRQAGAFEISEHQEDSDQGQISQ